MTRAVKIMPVTFEEFAPMAPSPIRAASPEPRSTTPEARFTQNEIDAAFAAGRAAGFDEAASVQSAAVAAKLAKLADALALEAARREEALEEHRRSLRSALHDLLTTLCRRLAARNAAPIALSLIDRMLAASAEKTPATLFVSEGVFASLGDRLAEAATRAGVEIGSDALLQDGECRLQWRGGAAFYSHDSVAAEIERVIAAADASGETP